VRVSKSTWFILALVASGRAFALDLLGVHDLARQYAPVVQGATAAQAEQQARLKAVTAQLGPQVSAEMSAQWQRAGGDTTPHQAGVQLSQTVIDAAKWSGRSAEQQRLAARVADQAHAAQQLRQESAKLYIQWHAQAQLLQAQQLLARAYADEATRMGIRHREGLAAAVDWRQSQSYQWLAEATARGGAQQLNAIRHALVAHAGDVSLLTAPLAPLRQDVLPPATREAVDDIAAPRLAALRNELEARTQDVDACKPRCSVIAAMV
jgi:outer membrane protein TolC